MEGEAGLRWVLEAELLPLPTGPVPAGAPTTAAPMPRSRWKPRQPSRLPTAAAACRRTGEAETGCSDQRRFELELEFLHCLANPGYLNCEPRCRAAGLVVERRHARC